MIYLDNSATTKPCAACVEAMQHMLLDAWGNPSSVHRLGAEAERCLRAARAGRPGAGRGGRARVFHLRRHGGG